MMAIIPPLPIPEPDPEPEAPASVSILEPEPSSPSPSDELLAVALGVAVESEIVEVAWIGEKLEASVALLAIPAADESACLCWTVAVDATGVVVDEGSTVTYSVTVACASVCAAKKGIAKSKSERIVQTRIMRLAQDLLV